VKGALKGDHERPPSSIACKLEDRFDGLGSGIAEERPGGLADRCKPLQGFRQFNLSGIIKIGSGHMNEAGGLPPNGRNDPRMRMAGGRHGDARGKVQIPVPIHIFHLGSPRPSNHQRIDSCHRL
jgi:hypothetical protein